jgi:predicted transcriptional regulator
MIEKSIQRHRSKISIYFDILQAVQENPDVKVTHIIHKANLPYDRLTAYLTQMEKDGLIVITTEGDNQRYIISQKGSRFVSEFKNIRGWANAFGLDL